MVFIAGASDVFALNFILEHLLWTWICTFGIKVLDSQFGGAMELLIKQGEIVDGTGEKSYKGDILISNGVITKIDKYISEVTPDVKTINAKGLVVTPGFIDMHSHSDATFTCDVVNEEKIRQGVTTQVNGNCGFGLFPMKKNKDFIAEVVKDLSSVEFYIKEEEVLWNDFEDFTKHFDTNFGTNHLPLVPHSLIRTYVIGFGDKVVSGTHIEEMKDLLSKQLDLGAWGMSTGLAYAPGCFCSYEEILELCKVLKEKDKIYFSHMRDEGDNVVESVEEVIKLAKESGCKAHISHLKAIGVKNHHKIDIIIKLINNAINEGISITADIYPYEASSTMLSILLPKKARTGSIESLIKNLEDEKYKAEMKRS